MQFALCAFSCSTLHCNMCTHSCNLYCCAKMICHFCRRCIFIYIFIYSQAAPSPDCPLEKFCCKSSDPQSQQKIIAALILTTAAAARGGGQDLEEQKCTPRMLFSVIVARHKHPNPATAWESSAKTPFPSSTSWSGKEIKIFLVEELKAASHSPRCLNY